jgi:hypothetical protein
MMSLFHLPVRLSTIQISLGPDVVRELIGAVSLARIRESGKSLAQIGAELSLAKTTVSRLLSASEN